MVLGDGDAFLNLERRFDHRGDEALVHVPFNVAME
jgi:hypothetical protein